MKIAYVLNTYPEGSHSFIRREIAALEQRGVVIERLAMRAPARPPSDPADIAEAAQTTYVLGQSALQLTAGLVSSFLRNFARTYAGMRLALSVGRASDSSTVKHLIYLAEACAVKKQCRSQGIDHIHAHFGTNAATVAMLASAISGIPFSFTVHGPEEFDRPEALSLREKIARSAFTVAISQFGRSQLCRWADPADWTRIKVVHCGIDPSKFADADPASMPAGPLRLVNIGRFAEQKGQMLLLEAMAEAKKRVPGLHLTLVGDGPLRPELEAAIAQHGLADDVTLAGWLDEDAVGVALRDAHALVLPSFGEGLPMVVMEAMASARLVIATFIAGIPELVESDTGWLVPAGDVPALVRAIVELAESPAELRRKMAQSGRARVLERHDINVLASELEAYFDAAVN